MPAEVEHAIVEKSKREGISLNKAVTQLLESTIQPVRRNAGFDEFAGSWTAEAARDFEQALEVMRRVDPGDWS